MDAFRSSFNNSTSGFLAPLDGPIARPLIFLFIILYAGLVAPQLPDTVKNWYSHPAFRIAFMFLILYTGNKDPAVSIAIAVAFLVIVNLANNKGAFETFEGPQTAIYPGCMNIKLFDLLESFKNDKEALMNAMLVSRVPQDVKLIDYYAPLIATYLLNHGFILKSPACQPPGVTERMGSWA